MNTGTHPRRMHNSYEDEEERKHFQRIVSAFRYYRWVCLAAEPDRRRSLLSLTIRFLFLDLDVEDRHDRRRQTSSRFSALMPKSRGKGIINHSDSICKRLPFRGPPPPWYIFTMQISPVRHTGILDTKEFSFPQFRLCLLRRTHSLLRVRKTESYFLSLPQHHQKLLSKYREHLQEVKRCIENNDQIIKLIIKDVAHIFENVCPTTAQIDNVRIIYLLFCYCML